MATIFWFLVLICASGFYFEKCDASSAVKDSFKRIFLSKNRDEIVRVEREGRTEAHWPLYNGQLPSDGSPSSYCAHVNHVLLLKNIFDVVGENAYFFRTAQQKVDDLSEANIAEYSYEYDLEHGIFKKPHMFYGWTRLFNDRYEILSSQEINESVIGEILSLVYEAESLRKKKYGPFSLFKTEDSEFETALMGFLEEQWTRISTLLGCRLEVVEILVIRNNLATKRYSQSQLIDNVASSLKRDSNQTTQIYSELDGSTASEGIVEKPSNKKKKPGKCSVVPIG